MKLRSSLYSLILVLLAGCMAPEYKVPCHPMPERFAFQKSASRCEPIGKWWHQFNDPILNALIKQALKTNYELRIALEKIEESRALYQEKRADLFPQIDVVSDVSRLRVSQVLAQTSFLQENILSFFTFGIDAFWELDIWGKLRNAKDAQYYLFEAQIENMRDIYIMLLAEVVRTYIQAVADCKNIRLYRERIEVDEKLLRVITDLFSAGLQSQVQVAQQEQELATSRDLYKQAQTNYAQSKNQLAVLLGINPETIKIPVAKEVPLSTARVATGIPSELIRRRPDIRQVERELASSNESVGQAIAEWFPSFTLLGGLSSDTSKGSDWFVGKSLAWTIGPSVRWPLINFGRIKANIKAKESVKRQAALKYSQSIIGALKEVEDFLVAYFNNLAQYDIIQAKLIWAKQQQSLIAAKFQSGLAAETDYLSAQKNSIDVSLSFVQAQQALSTNLVSLYKALGGGW